MTNSARDSRARLPLERDRFIGRRHELGELRRLLSQAPLVTLCGAGGVGKTRLALHAAAGMANAFADGVWLVELADVRHPERLERVVAASLGQREPVSSAAPQPLAAFLADRSMLLILDNCEHLVDAVAKLADSVLRACPGVRILATSRESLRTTGEAILQVNPLSVPRSADPQPKNALAFDAVELFLARAAAAAPDVVFDESNLLDVLAIVRRLEGVPLAIELAAAQLRNLTPGEVARRLGSPLRLLRGGRRDHPRRHQTLRECVAWSYAGCSDEEQVLWNRLSVFDGGFELDSAEGICAFGALPREHVLELLSSLVEKSVVSRVTDGDESRYRLPDSLREYGSEQLVDSQEIDLVQRRHSHWFAELAHRTRALVLSPDLRDHWRRIDREQANLEVAFDAILSSSAAPNESVRIVVSLWGYWVSRGAVTLGRAWVDRALEDEATTSQLDVLWANYVGAALAGFQGDHRRAMDFVRDARALAVDLDDPAALALAEHAEGVATRSAGDYDTSVACLRRASEFYRQQGATVLLCEALAGLIVSAGLSGDVELARRAFEEAMQISEAHGDVLFRAFALGNWGAVLWMTGDRTEVEEVLEECLRAGARIDELLMAVEVLPWLALLASENDEAERAVVLFGAAASLSRDTGITPMGIPADHARREDVTHELEGALGASLFARAFSRGRSMDHQAALSYALRDPVSSQEGADEKKPPSTSPLTARELEVSGLVSQGLTNKEIAARLVVAPRTVRGHVENILTKLDFANRAQIAAWFSDIRRT